jgi:hypothetical protein
VAEGTKRLVMMNVVDRSMPPPRWRTTLWRARSRPVDSP